VLVLFSGQSNCFADVLDLAEGDFIDFPFVRRFDEVRHCPEVVALYCGMLNEAVTQVCIREERMDGNEPRWADAHCI